MFHRWSISNLGVHLSVYSLTVIRRQTRSISKEASILQYLCAKLKFPALFILHIARKQSITARRKHPVFQQIELKYLVSVNRIARATVYCLKKNLFETRFTQIECLWLSGWRAHSKGHLFT